MEREQFIEIKHLLQTGEQSCLYEFVKEECDDLIVHTEDIPLEFVKKIVLKYISYCVLNSFNVRISTDKQVCDYIDFLLDRNVINTSYEKVETTEIGFYDRDEIKKCVTETFKTLFVNFNVKAKK